MSLYNNNNIEDKVSFYSEMPGLLEYKRSVKKKVI